MHCKSTSKGYKKLHCIWVIFLNFRVCKIAESIASVWRRYIYRLLAFFRETCVFLPVGLEKPLKIFKPFFGIYVTKSVRPTNTPNLVEISSQVASPRSGELSRFCDFRSPFLYIVFRLLIAPTGRNSRPISTLYDSNDVFCFIKVPFQGLKPSNSFLWGLRPKKNTKISTRFWTFCRFAAEIA